VHLAGVAKLARTLAQATGLSDLPHTAEAAGWLHDLGKYRESFQEFIRGRSPMGSKQHKEAGAAFAVEKKNPLLMFAILGHHVGIPDRDDALDAVKNPSGDGSPVWNKVRDVAEAECPELFRLDLAKAGASTKNHELFIRLLLSCLVDADWTDTSEHERNYKGWSAFPKSPLLEPNARLAKLLAFVADRADATRSKNPALADIRQLILDACLAAADQPKGLFTLTVPTGGGKTLSGMAFALKHAGEQGSRRIIYVAPYISILEQNADVIRASVGVTERDLDVFEHQSLSEPQGPVLAAEKQTSAAARRAENWDSPIVITTNVQFFESLFSNKPGQCRKLHNIAGSVIILDECQTLPPDLVKPTCQMLKQLVDHLGCTVVLCTATQPAFDHEILKEHRLTATEIIPSELKLFDHLKRVQIQWPGNRDERLTWSEVADRMSPNASALCVVNTKAAARDLFAELKMRSQHAFHLSTSMCPAHRTAILDAVKDRLKKSLPVFVVSTQLIEAGVDIDFPSVFREMGPLEAIIQAAGRCNREGHIPNAGGRVVVFRSIDGEKKIPSGWYRRGREVLEQGLESGKHPRIDEPADILDYFSRLYWTGDLDKENIVGLRAGLRFDSVAKAYRLIVDDTVPVVVAWKDDVKAEPWYTAWRKMQLHKDAGADIRNVQERLDALRLRQNRANFRALAPFQANVFRTALSQLPVVPLSENVDLLVWHGVYDSEMGLKPEIPLDNLIV